MRETNPFTILEYIKTSIEILMNMKMEEQQELRDNEAGKKKKNKRKKEADDLTAIENDSESVLSG